MAGTQGWDTAEFRCFRCGAVVTVATSNDPIAFGRAVAEHRATCPQGPVAECAGCDDCRVTTRHLPPCPTCRRTTCPGCTTQPAAVPTAALEGR
ncbi:hypothetical protein [Kitasatospora sp. NPDC057223]|uniref:hypothetical protein n=1 Tax=Kitasatospora sp. NPDC057223 TaxID=3346055 RepID=UPI00363206CA